MIWANFAGSVHFPECTSFFFFKSRILNQLGNEKSGKSKLMEMIKSENAEVREEALLATQKMMIHNWQTLKL